MSQSSAARAAALPEILPEQAGDAGLVDVLFDRAFGPGRFAKTAERVRENAPQLPDLSFCAWDGEALVGAVRQHAVRVGEARGAFLGPFAVDAGWRGRGLGPRLIRSAADAAEAVGLDFVLLVGPRAYFAPLGFEPAGGVVMPGPIEAARLQARLFRDGLTLQGRLLGG